MDRLVQAGKPAFSKIERAKACAHALIRLACLLVGARGSKLSYASLQVLLASFGLDGAASPHIYICSTPGVFVPGPPRLC